MLRYSTEPMFMKMQGAVLEDFGETAPRRHSLYQFMLAQDRFQDAFKITWSNWLMRKMSLLIRSRKPLKRLTWGNTIQIINSMRTSSFNKWRNDMALMILAWVFFDGIPNFSVSDKLFHTRNRALRSTYKSVYGRFVKWVVIDRPLSNKVECKID